MSERLDEIAKALDAEVVQIETDEWEIASGEHDGMTLAEYVRRFNVAAAPLAPETQNEGEK